MKNKKFVFYIFTFFASLFIFINNTFAVDITTNTTISSDTTYDSMVVKSGYTLTLDATLHVTGDVTIETGGKITHTVGSTTNFNLIVDGTLNIVPGGKIDMNEKGNSITGVGSQTIGASHGGFGGSSSSPNPYGDVYNPITVGAYGYNYTPGGGLVRMTVGNLINNGSILANARNSSNSYGQGAGGSINITVNSNISGTGVYQANGGYYSSSSSYAGGGGRIAIKFYSASDLSTLEANVLAQGSGYAGDGTIYLKNTSSGDQYIIANGNGASYSKSNLVNVDLNDFKEIIINGGSLTVTGVTSPLSIPYLLDIKNYGYLNLSNSSVSIVGGLNLNNSNFYSLGNISVNGNVSASNSANFHSSGFTISGSLNNNSGYFTISSLDISSNLNMTGGTLTSNSIDVNGNVFLNSGYITENGLFNIDGDFSIGSTGYITHNYTAVSTFNLIVDGTLNIVPGGKIDMNEKGNSITGVGSQTIGASHGGFGG
ncbi:MAG: hypothetical protein PHN31_03520, partial [Candidatus Gracilibacteria bacterium]|nr:hypothetical protein [Candidatus Gracilibacteria bacterium]